MLSGIGGTWGHETPRPCAPGTFLPAYFRVGLGGHPPRPPTDPYVRNYRIRFLRPRFRYAISGLMTGSQVGERVSLQQEVEPLPGQVGRSRAATEPLAPDPLDPVKQAVERP